MEGSIIIPPTPPIVFSDLEMLKFHWQNYQMRQSHFWRSFNNLILALGTLWSIPFIKPQLFNELYVFTLFFPLVALFLSFVGRRLLKSEYQRLKAVYEIVDRLTPLAYKPDYPLPKGNIGKIITTQVCIGLILISFTDILLVLAKLLDLFPKH
jgi:hypothetical protein